MADGRYVLVYHEDLIANFPQVWDDDKALATWLRLLALADKLWPSPAEMPRGVSATAVKVLTGCGLVEHLPRHRFRIRGLDSQRQRRVDAAKNAAAGRWGNADSNTGSNADGNAPASPKAMPHTDTDARPQSGLSYGDGNVSSGVRSGEGGSEPEWPVLVWLAEHKATVTPNGGKLHQRLIRLAEKHGAGVVIKVMAGLGDGLEANQYILGADNALNPIPTGKPDPEKTRAEAEEKVRQEYDRRVEKTRRDLAALRGEVA